jgi:hypothetical protein
VFDRELHHLFDLLHLLVQAADHVERGVRHFLHLHERHERVHERREDEMERVAVVLQRDARAGGERVDVYVLRDVHDVFTLGVNLTFVAGDDEARRRERKRSERSDG